MGHHASAYVYSRVHTCINSLLCGGGRITCVPPLSQLCMQKSDVCNNYCVCHYVSTNSSNICFAACILSCWQEDSSRGSMCIMASSCKACTRTSCRVRGLHLLAGMQCDDSRSCRGHRQADQPDAAQREFRSARHQRDRHLHSLSQAAQRGDWSVQDCGVQGKAAGMTEAKCLCLLSASLLSQVL